MNKLTNCWLPTLGEPNVINDVILNLLYLLFETISKAKSVANAAPNECPVINRLLTLYFNDISLILSYMSESSILYAL